MSIFSKTALTILFLATQHVALSKHLSSKDLSKKSNMHDKSPKEDVSRELWEKCYFQGSSYQPGHWVQGPTHTCLCSDSGSWVSCKENPKPCPYEGSSYQPGQWLQLPDKMCKCDHDGSGEWVDCKENTKPCSYEGHSYQPGHWLQGPDKICMCDRYGTGEWVNCTENFGDSGYGGGETELSRRQHFQDKDFVHDLLGSVPSVATESGTIQSVTVKQMPSLKGSGISYTLFNLEPCGINLPHVHPRATEFVYVIDGTDLRTAFMEENGGRVIVNDIGKGEVTFFPSGLIHYQQNLSCDSTTYISALNHEDPGVSTVTKFFDLPSEAVKGSLGQSNSLVQTLIDGLPSGPAQGAKECMTRCNIIW